MTYRVAMVGACPYFVPQGSQVYLKDTAAGLQTLGHDVHLVVYGYGLEDDGADLPIHRARTVPGARKTAAGPSFAKPFLDLALVAALRRTVRDEKLDIVHAHNYEGLAVALTAGKRPIVYHAHNAMADELPHYFGGNRAAAVFGRWLDRHLPRRADHVIVPHAALAEYLIACGCRLSHVTVIPPPADAAQFATAPVSDATPPVLYTGNLDAYQNLDLLYRAMDRVRRNDPKARLIVASAQHGPLPDFAAPRNQNGADIPVCTLVSVPDFAALRNVLAQDAIFACPRTSWSGYPIKLVNAMAAGLPAVACQSAAHPLTHEANGLIVPDNDTEAFADALLRLMKAPELRRRLGAQARKTVEAQHRPGQIAQRIAEVYAGLPRKTP